jgi:hypothetical protein
LKKDFEMYTSNINRWEDIKADLQDLGSNLRVDWFNHLRTKLGLPTVKPGSMQDKKLRKAFADRTVPHIDNQIEVLNRRRAKTEKDITRFELDYVELSQAQIQKDIDNEILAQFEQIAEEEIRQILKNETIKWDEYENVKNIPERWGEYQNVRRIPERSHGDWTVLGD